MERNLLRLETRLFLLARVNINSYGCVIVS